MTLRPAAIALLVATLFGCGGRPTTPVASDPSERPVGGAAPATAPARPAPAPATAERLDDPGDAPRPAAGAASDAAAPGGGVQHVLRRGQTLYSLARTYDLPLQTLMAANGIVDPRSVPAGAVLFIPGARAPRPYRPTAAGVGDAALRDPADGADQDDDQEGGDGVPGTGRHAVQRDTLDPLQWPLRGTITGRYGRRGRHGHHAGIDIDGRRGDAILAAGPGVVRSAGVDGPYGRRVEIDHGDGLVTLYAHADRILVRRGEQVRAGQRIADVGRSGNARGTHLHFEVRRDGRTVDPLPFLRDTGLLTAGMD